MDEELLDALKRGGEAAWDDAFRRLYPCVFAAAHHSCAGLTPSEAEDVAIETLTQLVAKVAQVKRFDELKALGATMASRRAISVQRKKYAEKRGSNQTTSLDHLKEATDGQFEAPAPNIESMNSSDLLELVQLLNEALAGLDDPTRKLINDYILLEIPYKELAVKHQIPIGTVGVMLSRGLQKTRTRLKDSPHLMKELQLFLR